MKLLLSTKVVMANPTGGSMKVVEVMGTVDAQGQLSVLCTVNLG